MPRSPDSLPPPPVPRGDAAETSPTSVRDPLLGLELGEYRITRRLGEGGMGVVYAGLQPVIQKPVAIKILQPEALGQTGEADRLIAEARAANAVRHRGIVDVFAFGKLPDGRPYIVMDLLVGEALDAVIDREAPLPLDRVLSILDDVLDTLSAAHAAGVIHRDLKPANMFLVRQANGEAYVRILDFGLAKRSAGAHPATRGSRASMVAGTPHYMAPEQALGQVVGPQADLYSVGCIAYELLTGRLPFDTEDPIEQIAMRLNEAPVRASSVARVPAELDEIVMRLLEREPSARPASAGVVRQQLSKYRRVLQTESTVMGPRPVGGPGPDEPTARALPVASLTPPPEQRVTKRTGQPRSSWALGVAVTGVVALLGVTAAAVLLPRGSAPDTEQESPEPPADPDEPPPGPDLPEPPRLAEPRFPAPPEPAPKPPPELRPEEPRVAQPRPEARPDRPRPVRPSAADHLEAQRKRLLAAIAKIETAHLANPALRNTVFAVRKAAQDARSEDELRKVEQRVEDELPPAP